MRISSTSSTSAIVAIFAIFATFALAILISTWQVAEAQESATDAESEQEEEKASAKKEYAVICTREAAAVAAGFARATAFLRDLPAISARFVQYSELGVVREGDFLLYPPYRMRLDYDAPSGLRLYVNAQEAMHVDTQRRFVRRYPLFSLPAVRMLQRIFSGKATNNLVATRLCTLIEQLDDPISEQLDEETGQQPNKRFEYLRVKFRKKKQKPNSEKGVALQEDASGYAELYFSYKPHYQFVGWDLHSSGSGTTRIRLSSLAVVVAPKISTFRFVSPWQKKRDDN